MKNYLFYFTCFFILIFSFREAQSASKPYQRAVILSGGGMQFAQFIGMLDGARFLNKEPDLIIGTCGGSLATAIAQAFPNLDDAIAFTKSESLYQLLRQAQVNPDYTNLAHNLTRLYDFYQKWLTNSIANVFADTVLHVPTRLGHPALEIPITRTQKAVVIVAGRILFNKKDAGKKRRNRKLFSETFFTDPITGSHLKGFESPIEKATGDSAIDLNTEVNTTATLAEAARAAITGTYYMEPIQINGNYYMGGTVDLNPIEVAKELADETIASFGEGFEPLTEMKATQAVYHYDINDRIRSIHDQEATYWVDATDRKDLISQAGFDPIYSAAKVRTQIPDTYEKFYNKVLTQIEYGRERMIEALTQARPNEKGHIRHMNSRNASDELLQQYDRFVSRDSRER
ncbi:MAG: hypothetical protein A4S09_10965 [Proteobacteria bacterium SG_bin7]|nr:MAG: hypothetical protein A4S09_10965 [Proteobacteria bacterium SG_bin7]